MVFFSFHALVVSTIVSFLVGFVFGFIVGKENKK